VEARLAYVSWKKRGPADGQKDFAPPIKTVECVKRRGNTKEKGVKR
jgi:hypothetical protein